MNAKVSRLVLLERANGVSRPVNESARVEHDSKVFGNEEPHGRHSLHINPASAHLNQDEMSLLGDPSYLVLLPVRDTEKVWAHLQGCPECVTATLDHLDDHFDPEMVGRSDPDGVLKLRVMQPVPVLVAA